MFLSTNKQECIRQLNCTASSYYVGVFGILLFVHYNVEELHVPNIGSSTKDIHGPDHLTSYQFVQNIKNHEKASGKPWKALLREVEMDAIKSLNRNYLKETFEIAKDYCQFESECHRSQWHLMKQQSWFRVAYVLRNCVSHNMLFIFDKMPNTLKNELKTGPFSYGDVIITWDLHGKPLDSAQISIWTTANICKDIREFVFEKLK